MLCEQETESVNLLEVGKKIVNWEVFSDKKLASVRVVDLLQEALDVYPPVIGLATGKTMVPIYDEMVHRILTGQLDLSMAQMYNLDEYLGMGREDPNSFAKFMMTHLIDPGKLQPDQLHIPNGKADPIRESDNYEVAMRCADQVSWQLVGIGHNGHIGFNEPGTPWDSLTHVVPLTLSTRMANAVWFHNDVDQVPTMAITMGLGTIMRSQSIVAVAFGEDKADIIAQIQASAPTRVIPASILKTHPHATFICDAKAGRFLPIDSDDHD